MHCAVCSFPFALHRFSSPLDSFIICQLFLSLSPTLNFCNLYYPFTMVDDSQEYRLQYWATCSSVRSFARTAHSFACPGLLASLVRSAALTRSLVRSLPSSWERAYSYEINTSISSRFYSMCCRRSAFLAKSAAKSLWTEMGSWIIKPSIYHRRCSVPAVTRCSNGKRTWCSICAEVIIHPNMSVSFVALKTIIGRRRGCIWTKTTACRTLMRL